ncbi:MAG: hydrogenase/urease maturation nickel metallochaperone HypA [Acidimicrobiales bacterium]
MHELGLCDAVVEAVIRRARGRPVSWARVRLGGHPVDPSVITQGVAVAAAGTEAEAMVLELVLDPARARCRRCGAEEEVVDGLSLAVCRRCGGMDVEMVGAEHAVLEAVGYRAAGVEAGGGKGATEVAQRAGRGEVDSRITAGKEGSWTPSSS